MFIVIMVALFGIALVLARGTATLNQTPTDPNLTFTQIVQVSS